MKNNYLKSIITSTLLFVVGLMYSQTPLTNSEFGPTIQEYLNDRKEELSLLDSDIQDIYVNSDVYSSATRVTNLYLNQRFQGIKIYNAISSIAIRNNSVFYYANRFLSDISQNINTIAPSIDPSQAIQNAASHFNLGSVQNLEIISEGDKEYLFTSGNISQVDIPVTLMFMPTAEGEIKLSWDISIHTLDGKHWWSTRVDAVTGEIIHSTDWVLTCNFGDSNHTNHNLHQSKINEKGDFNLFKSNYVVSDGSQYNVFPLPVESPFHGSRLLLNEPADDTASPYGWHDTDGSVGPEFTITRGNNVYAQEDRNANNGSGYSPDGASILNFDFPLDFDQPPALYEDASITNLFYMNNMMHDVWYHYGFNPRSGNFQEDNYGDGGTAGDFVFADGQDGAGLNNATFGTPPDGGNPSMTMFLWFAAGPPGEPLTINNGSLAGDYSGLPAGFGAVLTSEPITADLALVLDDDSGASSDPNDACDNITNGGSLSGKIVVIRRGECEFGVKILAAENEGAIAVIMVNNVADDPITMGAGEVGDQVTIPSIMVSQSDGEAIIAELEGGGNINGTLVDAGPYQRDGSLDNSIVAHEYTHGISNRLTGGRLNTGCLGNAEQMGEGWSDWFALMMLINEGDTGDQIRGMATYALNQDPDTGGGLREAPYSTSFSINDYTYGDTNANVTQPHGIGFVWATMLWDLTWAYIDKYGFDPDLLYGTGGNNKIMQIVMNALKFQPCSPGFIDGRDAILSADQAITDGEDQCLIWEVFANRGLGVGASQGLTESRSDQIENFSMPDPSDPSLANCSSLSVDEFNNDSFNIYPNPTDNNLNIKVDRDFGKAAFTIVDLNGRVVFKKNSNLSGLITLNLGQLQSGVYILNISGENINVNEKIVID